MIGVIIINFKIIRKTYVFLNIIRKTYKYGVVTQLAECWIVYPKVEGSNPFYIAKILRNRLKAGQVPLKDLIMVRIHFPYPNVVLSLF
jgi:hypothetical protein